MRRIRRSSIQAGVAACAIALPVMVPAALDAQVFVRTQEDGQGLLRARNQECFVITPLHAVRQAQDADRILLVAQGRVERYARFEADYGNDVAVLRVEADRPLACPSEWNPGERLSELLRNALEGVIESMREDGSPQRHFVRITGYDDRSVSVRAVQQGDALRRGLSGSRLVIAGVPAGMLQQVDNQTGEGVVLRHDFLTDLLHSFFGRAVAAASDVRPIMDVQTAIPILDRAVAAKDLSQQGQVQALEALLAAGLAFGGADLSGIRLSGANLSGAQFGGTMLAGTDLSGARAVQADLTEANLAFTRLTRADLSEATLVGARAGFADADSAVFANARAKRASFYGASLRSADFRGADLTGASFVMADLRGARLDGANLTDALFFASRLEGATFARATVANTEVSGSSLPQGTLSAAQVRGACTSWDDSGLAGPMMNVSLIERIPSSRFSGGVEYAPLTRQGMFGLYQFSTRGLARCGARSGSNPGIFGDNRVSTDWGGGFDAVLISKADRRRAWVRRVESHMQMMMAELNAWHRR
jgi:uncharacterized protein YjbI with pentapeptide repeats